MVVVLFGIGLLRTLQWTGIENSSAVSRAVTGDEMPQSAASAYSGSVVYNRKYSQVQKTPSFPFFRNLGAVKDLVYPNIGFV